MNENITELLKTLPPIVACVVWDVLNANITLKTIELADRVTQEEWEEFEVIRCVAAGNPERPPVQESQVLVEMMLEELALQIA